MARTETAVSRLARTYTLQVETLRRLRNGGSQFVRVEHVHVHAGGQAVVGMIETPERGNLRKRDQSDE
jgi:hypothetical protein